MLERVERHILVTTLDQAGRGRAGLSVLKTWEHGAIYARGFTEWMPCEAACLKTLPYMTAGLLPARADDVMYCAFFQLQRSPR